jgi:hypothetical protein
VPISSRKVIRMLEAASLEATIISDIQTSQGS